MHQQREEIQKQAAMEAEAMMWNMKKRTTTMSGTGPGRKDSTWDIHQDPTSGAVFYENRETGATQWEDPLNPKTEAVSILWIFSPIETQLKVDVESPKEDIEAIKERIKAAAAEELAAQVQSVLASTAEERENLIKQMREEFADQMKETAKQTQELAGISCDINHVSYKST